jgi:hypothetical protein
MTASSRIRGPIIAHRADPRHPRPIGGRAQPSHRKIPIRGRIEATLPTEIRIKSPSDVANLARIAEGRGPLR